jgi:hypothetical protein
MSSGGLPGKTPATFRLARGSSLRERQRLERGIKHIEPAKPTERTITLHLRADLVARLAKATSRPIEEVVAEIVSGVVVRGSIDAALSQWGDYLTDHRGAMATSAGRRRKEKRDGDVQLVD